MSIKQKFVLPMFLIGFILSILGYFILNIQIKYLNNYTYKRIATIKQNQIKNIVDFASNQAIEMASIFAQLPVVLKAFKIAHSGNINDENDEKLAQARQLLRLELKDHLKGYEKNLNGKKMKLHFHLPNGRSLVRMWRDKQVKRGGIWLDISDDISKFRNTVLDVFDTGKPVKGIELGRGGFVIRGLVPIKESPKKTLGSVEILLDFNSILQNVIKNYNELKGQCLYLFMNYDKLSITTRLQDPRNHPIIENKYVYIYSTNDEINFSQNEFINANLLDMGKESQCIVENQGKIYCLSSIKDYKNDNIGIILYVFNEKQKHSLSTHIVLSQLFMLLVFLIVVGSCMFFMITKIIIKPVSRLVNISAKIASGDLSETLDEERNDEIGKLFVATNYMIKELRKIVTDVKCSGKELADSSGQMKININTIASATEEMNVNVQNISVSSTQMSGNVNTVSTAIEGMSSSINAAGKTAKQGANISNDAVILSEKAGLAMNSLGESANEIGEVTEVIKKISDKTSLLALNAHIEAASAGDAGKGFAVVANEIKDFAQQSTRAADDIATRISSMQENTKEAVDVIKQVINIINNFNISAETIFSELSAQVDSANGISHNISEAKNSANEIAFAMTEIAQGTMEISKSIGMAAGGFVDEIYHEDDVFIDSSAAKIETLAQKLLQMVDNFKTEKVNNIKL